MADYADCHVETAVALRGGMLHNKAIFLEQKQVNGDTFVLIDLRCADLASFFLRCGERRVKNGTALTKQAVALARCKCLKSLRVLRNAHTQKVAEEAQALAMAALANNDDEAHAQLAQPAFELALDAEDEPSPKKRRLLLPVESAPCIITIDVCYTVDHTKAVRVLRGKAQAPLWMEFTKDNFSFLLGAVRHLGQLRLPLRRRG